MKTRNILGGAIWAAALGAAVPASFAQAEMVEDKNIHIQVHLSTHGFSNNLEENRLELAERKAGEPNVFVNADGVLKQVEGLRGRAEKRLEIEKKKEAQ